MGPFLAFLIHPATIAVGAVSAFVAAQLDDKLDTQQHPYSAPVSATLDPVKVGLYVAGGLGLFWLANKSGFLKAIS